LSPRQHLPDLSVRALKYLAVGSDVPTIQQRRLTHTQPPAETTLAAKL